MIIIAVVIAAAVMLIMLLVVWFTLTRQTAPLSYAYVLGQRGHFGSFHSDQFTLLCVTNKYSATVDLHAQVVQWDQGGLVMRDMATLWGGENGQFALSSHQAAILPFSIPTNAETFQIGFSYSWSGGKVLKLLSHGVRKLPRNSIPEDLRKWLLQNGLLDGEFHRELQLPWMTNQPMLQHSEPAVKHDQI